MKGYRKNRIPQIIFGCDTAKEAGAELQAQCVTKCLIVTDNGVEQAGLTAPVLQSLEASGIEYIIFDEVVPETPDTVCMDLAQLIMENHLDGVLAIGGGSVIDTAKAAAMIPCLPQPVEDLHEYGGTGALMKNAYTRNIKFVAMPTTSGTGAEITCSSVVLDTKRHLKYSFMNPSMSPDLAIVDPMLTVGMPPKPTAVVGLDVLCHATENLLGAQQNEYSDLLMLECIKRVWQWLPIVFEEPGNIEGRTQLSWASTNAQANGGVPQGHAIGHAIGAAYGLVHGHACTLVLPSVIRHHAESYPDKIYALAQIVGVPTEEEVKVTADRVAKKYVSFYKQFGFENLQVTLKGMDKLDDRAVFVEKMIPLTLDDFKSRIWMPPIHRQEDRDLLTALLEKIYDEQ
ncbi:MAG: iron-containing alcohol dehydrogenase [Eubacterium sp.]|nr:iron-containing alcohol dehydrogenase [Eubacterium sp.]